jgi:hypothetical protein
LKKGGGRGGGRGRKRKKGGREHPLPAAEFGFTIVHGCKAL